MNFIPGCVSSICVLFGFNESNLVFSKILLPLIYLFLAKKTFVRVDQQIYLYGGNLILEILANSYVEGTLFNLISLVWVYCFIMGAYSIYE